ncbi:MAG: S41 family peptidase [Planctomycetia bacterium]|nr:S41 family peptidase [Planctomycetia bacterium]
MKKFILCFFLAAVAVTSPCPGSLFAQHAVESEWTPWRTSNVGLDPPQTQPPRPVAPTPLVTVEANTSSAPALVPIPQMTPLVNPAATTEIANIIQQGNLFVQEERWAEARSHFEKALRRYPNNTDLHDLFLLARSHVDVQNRYSDSSFQDLVKEMTLDQCMAFHDEIFNNIQKYHVDTPHWRALLHAGLNAFDVAAGEAAFLERYGVSEANEENLHRYLTLLKQESQNWDIDSFPAMRRYVLGIADSISKGVSSIPPTAVIMELVCGMTNSLDTYSTFLTRNQVSDVYSMIDGHFVGLGLELKADSYSLIIVRVIANSPAAKAGLVPGERIVAIDSAPTCAPHSFDQAANLLQGPEGSSVRLTLRAESGTQRELTVIRRQVEVPSVENVRILNPDSTLDRVGYLKISCFQKTTVAELVAAMRYLDSQEMKLLMIDLRQNPGGLLQEAIEATNLFVEKGTIVKTRGREQERPYYATAGGTWKIPLIVLIDENSASASEIFAGGIRENNRGRVVGTRSYGKGTVQAIIQLGGWNRGMEPVAGLRLTTEKFYSPLGRAYSGAGVDPDVLVVSSESESQSAFRNVSQSGNDRPGTNGQERGSGGTLFHNAAREETTVSDLCLDRAFEEAQKILLGNRTVATPL